MLIESTVVARGHLPNGSTITVWVPTFAQTALANGVLNGHMQTTPNTPTTKVHALNSLGVFDAKAIAKLSSHLEFVRVSPGRRLIGKGDFAPSTMIVVSGSISVTADSGVSTTLEAPSALDHWATNDRRISQLTAIAGEDTALILIDWSYRDAAFGAIDCLERISAQTQRAVATSMRARKTVADPQPASVSS